MEDRSEWFWRWAIAAGAVTGLGLGWWLLSKQRRAKITGQGKVLLETGELYDGDLVDGLPHGFGVSSKDGAVFRGHWMQGRPHGVGTLSQPGISFEGVFDATDMSDDMVKIKGILQDEATGLITELDGKADWKGTKMEGTAIIKKPDGSIVFEGHVDHLGWQGEGKCYLDDGSVYDGLFLNNTKHGQGKMEFANGDVYSGSWVRDMRSGHGKMTYAEDESVFEGEWRENSWWEGRLLDKSGRSRMVINGAVMNE